MARKKKKLSIEEELIELEREVTECKDEIQKLTERKKELKQLIEQKQMEVLHQAVLKSGKSIKEVIALINEDTQEEKSEKSVDETVTPIHGENE